MHDLNLIPQKFFIDKAKPKAAATLIAALLILCAISFYFVLEPVFEKKRLEAKSSLYNPTIAELNEVEHKINKLTEEHKIMNKRIQALKAIDGNKLRPTEALEAIKNSMPKDVDLTGISYSQDGLSLTAQSKTALGVSEYYVELMKNNRFSKVTLSPVSKSVEGYSFAIYLAFTSGSGDNDEKTQSN